MIGPMATTGKAGSRDPLAPYRGRVGSNLRDRLTWALQLAQRPAETITPGDLENLRYEMAAALEAGGHKTESVESPRIPDAEEAQAIHARLKDFFEKLLEEEEIPLDGSLRKQVYKLNRGSGKWERWELGTPNSVDALLEQLIPPYGHLIRECEAPRALGKGERCGVWFVAKRDWQTFCSARCNNRAGAQAFREKKKEKEQKNRRRQKRRRSATSRPSSSRGARRPAASRPPSDLPGRPLPTAAGPARKRRDSSRKVASSYGPRPDSTAPN